MGEVPVSILTLSLLSVKVPQGECNVEGQCIVCELLVSLMSKSEGEILVVTVVRSATEFRPGFNLRY